MLSINILAMLDKLVKFNQGVPQPPASILLMWRRSTE
jgi:hypothetical protein